MNANDTKGQTVAILGPKGTNGHLAYLEMKKQQGLLLGTKPVFVDSHRQILRGVEEKEFDHGIVPIENSSTGSIFETIHFWTSQIDKPSNIQIVGEQWLSIQLCIAGKKFGGPLMKLLSKQEVFDQCRDKLSLLEMTQECSCVHMPSTSAAVKMVQLCKAKSRVAAITSEKTARAYGLSILARNIEDHPQNSTRFHWITNKGIPASQNSNKWIIILKLKNEIGTLARVTGFLRDFRMNMTNIHSLPTGKPDEYLFYIEFMATRYSFDVFKQIFHSLCESYKVIGNFEFWPMK